MKQSIVLTLQGLDIPVAYSHFKTAQQPPFVVYIGNGQNTFEGDDTHYWRQNTYQVEYYFERKDEAVETSIEDALLAGGWLYEKSEDTFIESEGLFVIYYQIS